MIALTGTFVLDTVTETVSWWMSRLRPDVEVAQAPYGQVLESLHDPAGLLRTNTGINVVLVRPDDLMRTGGDRRVGDVESADRLLDLLVAGLTTELHGTTAVWLVGVLPPAPATAAQPLTREWVDAAATRIAGVVADTPWLHLLDLAAAAERYDVAALHDEYGDTIGHLPYTDEYLAAVGTVIARTAEALRARPRKVVVLDCDNTLWRGVCGEDGPEGVVLTEQHLWLQRFMAAQRANGRLLCLCSRNNEADVLAVFTERPDMVLRIDDVTARRIGWGPKPAAIAELAAELGLAVDSFVFVDDDPVECGMVRAELPGVAVVQVPREPELIRSAIEHEWVFDQFVVTEDDRLRADRYAAESRRRTTAAASADHAEFLRRCRIEVAIEPVVESTVDRVAQLTARTTQFTLTGEQFTAGRVSAFLAGGGLGWTVRMHDRFGDYGIVGALLAEPAEDALDVRVLLMSCRVLNRELEHRMLEFLAAHARSAGRTSVRLPFRPTERNTPARLFLASVTGADVPAEDATFRLPAKDF
ncbi:HAD-IIIC family phosphatase [Lentzea sp. NPDC059081]|uniref:HAD-IIIC family phosphatase n=1 Tax=Lentzea sp. NPDC059081 TaxID=3346719 RepID=UPI0036CD7DA8